MKLSFIGQGLTPEPDNTTYSRLATAIKSGQYETLHAFVAFVSSSGATQLTDLFDQNPVFKKHSELFIGIDQKATSKEALEVILKSEIKTYLYYSVSFPIYHPKIYILRGPNQFLITIGSSNLTDSGLFQNVEASLMVSFDKHCKDGLTLLSQIENYYATLLSHNDPNLKPLNAQLINDLFIEKIIPSESERAKLQAALNAAPKENKEKSFLSNLFPPRKFAAAKPSSRSKAKIKNSRKIEAYKLYNVFWFEARKLTGGSNNQLDLSKRGGLGHPGGSVSLFGVNGQNESETKDITLIYKGKSYHHNTILFPRSKKTQKSNDTWRFLLKGETRSGEKLSQITSSKAFQDKILVMKSTTKDTYELIVEDGSRLEEFKKKSIWWDANGNKNGRCYGTFQHA